MRCDLFYKTSKLHVKYIYMTSVRCYMFWRSTVICREPHQYW